MAARVRTGLVLVLLALVVLGGRLFQLQGLDTAGMAQAAVEKRLRTTEIPALRGEILDANNNVLARSVQRFDIVVDQRLVKDYTRFNPKTKQPEDVRITDAIARLAEVLGQETDTVADAVLGDRPFNYVAKAVTPEVKNRVERLSFPGLQARETTIRNYPNGEVAGSVIGFLGSDGNPLAGIEATQDEVLSGTPGERTYEIGADGIRIPVATNEEVPAEDGRNVKLTLNTDVQWFAQETIAEQVRDYGAEYGTIVVVNARTGDIIAMAESTTPDPNDPGATPVEQRQPFSVTKAFEPGSTTKMITMAAAIEEGITTPTTRYTIPPSYSVNGQRFTDAVPHGTVQRTTAGIFAKSMNTGTVMIGQHLTRQQRYDYLRKFGIGELYDIGLTGMTSGLLAKPGQWDGRQEYTVLFGQGLAQTALHTAMAYAAIANDGVRMQPRLIDSYVDPDGTEHKLPREKGVKVVSKKTAGQVQDLLETVSTQGGGLPGKVEDYRVGVKTGTAEAPSDDGGFSGYTISMAGIAPMEDPEFVVVATIQRPKGGVFSLTAGPPFKKVMGQVLSTYNVPPSTTKPVKLPLE
ncbi:penicillin-binding protein 2 [Arthrobacter sp. E918]|uniref:Penicillin-binding protein 2 n=2 Tax=Arthrobacter mobilis TaxID=2724944 RepID=A0A7X6HEZ8_9MICC|nr:penicillin-binding protein 2 [Arthrobacter mobilis]